MATTRLLEFNWQISRVLATFVPLTPLFQLRLERAMGIEPVANSLSPVESVGLTLLEDLNWA